ncbi:MAG: hypothetical protein Q8P84_07180, partial [Deltaproteobacteria bacterium]|nr:hypothetical protein [Deltaproteobacteria bacterium]
MVDKIDKPEAPSPYAVIGTTETKRDKPQDQKGQEDLPTFQKETPSLYKEKFQGDAGVGKTLRFPISEIRLLKFRRAVPRHGAPIVEADLVLNDGKIVEGVHFLLRHLQDFLKIKNLKIGDPVPEAFWKKGETMELTLRPPSSSGPWNLKEIQKENRVEKPL